MKNISKKKIVSLVIIAIVFIAITIAIFPYMMKLKDEEGREAFQNFIDSFGFWGVFVLIGIQFLQVVIAFIPGELVEIVAGMMYGGLGGMLVFIAGNILASTIIFHVIRYFKPVKYQNADELSIVDEKKYKRMSLEKITFIVFLIPGTPKDALNYVMPFTKIKFTNFIIISTIARIPSIITSTIVGGSISKGNFWTALWVFVGSTLFSLLLVFLYSQFEKKNKIPDEN